MTSLVTIFPENYQYSRQFVRQKQRVGGKQNENGKTVLLRLSYPFFKNINRYLLQLQSQSCTPVETSSAGRLRHRFRP